MELSVEHHPSLLVRAFICRWTRPLGEQPAPAIEASAALLRAAVGTAALQAPDDSLRAAIRDMLRHGGFKPTGRSKPSSEYLLRASQEEGGLRAINAAVDAGNAVSLHSGLPISVVDRDKLSAPLSIKRAGEGESYVFNPGGQVIDVSGLLCLYDAQGACANAVKDAQRTKTSEATVTTLSIVWSSQKLGPQTDAALQLYAQLLHGAAEIEPVAL